MSFSGCTWFWFYVEFETASVQKILGIRVPVLAAALAWSHRSLQMESLLVRPLIPPSWGIVEGYVVGVIHPWGMGIPCRFVSRSKPTTIEYTGASVSQPPITTYIFQYFLSNLIPGGIIWVVSWWLWFISTDKRGKAHPLCSGNNQRQKQGRDHHSFFGTKWCNFHETTPWHADRRQPRKTLSRKVLGKHTS